MKRDMDLVKRILEIVEDADAAVDLLNAAIEDKSSNEIGYHAELLIEHGFLDGKVQKAWGGDYVSTSIKGLTWDGQDFLESMRDKKVWSKAKKVIRETVGSTTFSVIKETCNLVALSMIKKAIEA